MKSWYLVPRTVGAKSTRAEPSWCPPTPLRQPRRLRQAPPQRDLKKDDGGGRSGVEKAVALPSVSSEKKAG
jgi:hypothetical protein